MCDYSLQHVASRPATVGDILTTKNFGTGTIGFAGSEDMTGPAVCVLPGTELAFDADIVSGVPSGYLFDSSAVDVETAQHRTARFRQINKEHERMHHDALELPDGEIVMLTSLAIGQKATVLQLPATPKNEVEVEEQRRVEVVG